MSRRSKWALGLVAVLTVTTLGWLALRWIVASQVGEALATRGMACAPIEVTPSADLRRLDVAPTRCTFAEGRVASMRAPAGLQVFLDEEQNAERVRVPGLELDMRDEPPREIVRALVEGGEAPRPLRQAMQGLSALAEREDLPRVRLDRVLIQRDGRAVTLRDVVMDRDGDAVAFRVEHAAPPAFERPRLRFAGQLVDLAARATVTEARLSGRLELEARLGPRTFAEQVRFRLDATDLDAEVPDVRIAVNLTEGLRDLRERARRRREARAQDDDDGPGLRDRVHRMADRLRDAAGRVRARAEESSE